MDRRLALALAGLAAGCPDAPSAPADAADVAPDADAPRACEAGGATLAVGTGSDSTTRTYRPLADGDDVYLVPGPQGAQHVWVGLRATGVDPTQPRVQMRAFRASDGELLGQLIVRLRMTPAPEDPSLHALSSQTLIIEDDRYCSVLPGDIRVAVDFDDNRGHCFHVERRLRLADIDPTALDVDREARVRCCRQMLRRCFPDGGVDAGGQDAAAD